MDACVVRKVRNKFEHFFSSQILHCARLLLNLIAWDAWARQGRVRLQHLRDLILSGGPQTQPALQQDIALLLASMPPSWTAHVCGPSPRPTHMVSAAPANRRVFCPDADGQLIHTHTVTATAAQIPAPAVWVVLCTPSSQRFPVAVR